jgi:integrase
LLFALVRFAGLRCPSEVFSLRWQDVDWERSRFTVTSPKTEHHEGKESRIIPIFEELRPHLEAAFDAAPDGAEFCIVGIGRKNPGTELKRIISRAGVTPWPKLFVNCRGSRETELAETYPIQTVTAWIGHSPTVALRNYLQVPSEHFDRASAVQKEVQGGAKAVQYPVQPRPVSYGLDLPQPRKPAESQLRAVWGIFQSVQKAPRTQLSP